MFSPWVASNAQRKGNEYVVPQQLSQNSCTNHVFCIITDQCSVESKDDEQGPGTEVGRCSKKAKFVESKKMKKRLSTGPIKTIAMVMGSK